MTKDLFYHAVLKFLLGVIIVGGLLFFSAGSVYYWQAWLLMAILFIPMFSVGIILMVKNPELLKRRLAVKEKQVEQKHLISISGLMFVCGFVVAGLNVRLSWMILPHWVSWTGTLLFLSAYLIYAEVLRENRYLSRVVEVWEGQQVIDKGLYGIVRHPMYSATIILFLSIPLVLGSVISFVIFLIYPFILVKRTQNEEQVLEKELAGYMEYKKRVRYKLISFIW